MRGTSGRVWPRRPCPESRVPLGRSSRGDPECRGEATGRVRVTMPEPTSIGGSARLDPSLTFSRTPEISMNHWPVQVTLIDSSNTQGARAELGVLATDFPEEP